MRAMLLAAGLGTRLRPLTDERPKPTVPVGLEPLAADALRAFVGAGVTRIDVNAFHLPDVLEQTLAPLAPRDVPFVIRTEKVLLGTGGGIRACVGGTDEPVLVMNGDIRFQPDVAALVRRQRESGALATLVVRTHPDPFALGAVEVDHEGRILRIAGRPEGTRPSAGAYVFTGVHLLSPEAVERLPVEGCVVRGGYQPLIAEGRLLDVVVDTSPWADLGTIPVYLAANVALAESSRDVRGMVHAAAVVDPRAELQSCVVGADARVGPQARLCRVVVWDGAEVDEPLEDAIVTRRGVVRVG